MFRVTGRARNLPFLFHQVRLTENTVVAPNIQVLRFTAQPSSSDEPAKGRIEFQIEQ